MEMLDFIKLACSKDQTRSGITGVYRDKTCYVATDGHRLHFSRRLPAIKNPHFLDERIASFPDWKQLVPKSEPSAKFSMTVTRECFVQLDGMLRAAKAWRYDAPTSLSIQESEKGSKLIFCHNAEGITCEVSIPIKVQSKQVKMDTEGMAINLSYLMDVIRFCVKQETNLITVQYFGCTQPWLFEISDGTAVIMPMKMS